MTNWDEHLATAKAIFEQKPEKLAGMSVTAIRALAGVLMALVEAEKTRNEGETV